MVFMSYHAFEVDVLSNNSRTFLFLFYCTFSYFKKIHRCNLLWGHWGCVPTTSLKLYLVAVISCSYSNNNSVRNWSIWFLKISKICWQGQFGLVQDNTSGTLAAITEHKQILLVVFLQTQMSVYMTTWLQISILNSWYSHVVIQQDIGVCRILLVFPLEAVHTWGTPYVGWQFFLAGCHGET